ncbi:DMT family transporter [Pseudooceanicola sp.]|uniref:DMT family transporter n=1 Tax=Pseudooceanicola sp. TaxID=1914328 RepID=UPI0026065433|nr:DMT family transporter [Pseudooceanicola sp.]MDF1857243.1 DMT family transporter [Pseudooceanicola sp.]
MTDNFRGALLMLGSMAFFTLNDSCTKLLADSLPLSQVITLRGILTSLATALIAWRLGAFAVRLSARDRNLIVLRTAAEAGTAYFFITALFNMPLANVTAVLQSTPLIVTLAAALFLGEPVGWRRLGAILVGFVGVLLILRPGPEGFTIYSAYTLAAVGLVTVRDLATRKLSHEVPSMLVSFVTATGVTLAFAVAGAVQADWVAVDARSGALILAAAVAVLVAYLCSVAAIRCGEISFVSPFRYSGLLFALLLGLVIFGHWPEWPTLAGAAIVVSSGLFMLYRERTLGLPPTAPVKTPRS